MEGDKDVRIEQLEKELAHEKEKNALLEKKVLDLKERIIDLSTKAEAEEEAITIKLMKRMNELRKEKEQLMKQVDIEEDHIANKLLKKLDELQREKINLEQKLEYEQECMVNRLQRQIQAIHREKSELQNRLREDTQLLLRTIHSSIDLLQQARSASATPMLGPQSAETPSECEELKDLSLTPAIITGPARLHRISGSPIPTMPTMPTIQAAQAAQAAQEKVLEGERKMKELLVVVDGMEKALNSGVDEYASFPTMNDDTLTRLRTGSLASSRSRSNSVIGRERSRHGSFCQ